MGSSISGEKKNSLLTIIKNHQQGRGQITHALHVAFFEVLPHVSIHQIP